MEINMTEDRANPSGRSGGEVRQTGAARSSSTWAWLCSGISTPADRRNQLTFLALLFAWMVAYTVAALALKGRLGFDLGLGGDGGDLPARAVITGWVVALLPNVLLMGAVVAYLRFLRMADELTRLVQMQGLAVGWGVTVVFLLNWELFEVVGAPALDPSDALLVPIFAWVLGQAYAAWRYR
jgi:hypothetical protein